MAIYNGERLKVGYNRTPTKFYKNYADRIKKVEEFRILQDTYKSEMCNLKKENHRLKHELDSFIVVFLRDGIMKEKHYIHLML